VGASSRYRSLTISREMLSSTFLDAEGRPSFNILQNLGTRPETPLALFVFDVMILNGPDVTGERLSVRRELLESKVLPKLKAPVRYLPPLEEPLDMLIQAVKAQGFEGLTGKRKDSRYEPGERSGAWLKMREQGAGVRDRRLRDRHPIRRADLRLLRGWQAALRRSHMGGIHTGDACANWRRSSSDWRPTPARSPTCLRSGRVAGAKG
jgi:ATP-dependent DNA ligase